MASSSPLEQRVADLEVEVAALKRKLDNLDRTTPWWEQIAGTFENDPIYEKAMQLGRIPPVITAQGLTTAEEVGASYGRTRY